MFIVYHGIGCHGFILYQATRSKFYSQMLGYFYLACGQEVWIVKL